MPACLGARGIVADVDSIRVLVVDDHPVVRRGLHSMLDGESGISIIGLASSGREGVVLAEKLNPDVVLLDLRMPDMSGVDVIMALRATRPQIKFLILTNHQLDEDIFNALDAGALGYLLKSASEDEVVEGITNKEIAGKLFISDITARNHVISLLAKLNAKDRTEAATTAIRRGLVRLNE